MRVLAGALAAVALLAAPAAATTLTGPQAGQFQRWADRSRVPTPHERVEVWMGGCPGSGARRACTSSSVQSIYLYPGASRHVFMHELGHRFAYRMARAWRDRFRVLTDDDRAWNAPGGPAEAFADAYAACAIDGGRRAACRLIWQAARERRGVFDFPANR